MKRSTLLTAAATGLISICLVACTPTQTTNVTAATQVTQLATAAPSGSSLTLSASTVTPARQLDLSARISGVGRVAATRDAELLFRTQGTVEQVLVQEGQQVQQNDVLAVLDTRPLDRAVDEAQASLDASLAQQAQLTQAPRNADLRAAQVQIRQAEISVSQAQLTQPQDVRSAEAQLTQAQAQLQSQRDALSRSKTAADAQVEIAAQSLVQAQAAYAKAKTDWDFVRETNQNPAQPDTVDPQTGEEEANTVEDTVREQYYAAFVQAEAALRQAEQAVAEAQIDAEQARQAEVTGIQSAEQQVTQAQAALDRANLPQGSDGVAIAQAGLEAAKIGLAQLYPDPGQADLALAAANVRRAEAALNTARLNREYAELRAPFAGIISVVNVDPGDPSSAGNLPVMEIIDVRELRVEVPINDVDIGRVQVGQQAELYIDSTAGTVFTGTVSYVAPDAIDSGGVRTYDVYIDLNDQEQLRPGLTARVEIIVDQTE